MPTARRHLPVADQRLLDCGPHLAQVRRRRCRVDRDVDIRDGVGAGIVGGAVVDGHRQGDRAVCGDPPHSLGQAGRQSRKQRVAGSPSACARASHSSASTKTVAIGSVMRSSAAAGGAAGAVDSGWLIRHFRGCAGLIVLPRRRRGRSRGCRARFGGRPRAAPASVGVTRQQAS